MKIRLTESELYSLIKNATRKALTEVSRKMINETMIDEAHCTGSGSSSAGHCTYGSRSRSTGHCY